MRPNSLFNCQRPWSVPFIREEGVYPRVSLLSTVCINFFSFSADTPLRPSARSPFVVAEERSTENSPQGQEGKSLLLHFSFTKSHSRRHRIIIIAENFSSSRNCIAPPTPPASELPQSPHRAPSQVNGTANFQGSG